MLVTNFTSEVWNNSVCLSIFPGRDETETAIQNCLSQINVTSIKFIQLIQWKNISLSTFQYTKKVLPCFHQALGRTNENLGINDTKTNISISDYLSYTNYTTIKKIFISLIVFFVRLHTQLFIADIKSIFYRQIDRQIDRYKEQ